MMKLLMKIKFLVGSFECSFVWLTKVLESKIKRFSEDYFYELRMVECWFIFEQNFLKKNMVILRIELSFYVYFY